MASAPVAAAPPSADPGFPPLGGRGGGMQRSCAEAEEADVGRAAPLPGRDPGLLPPRDPLPCCASSPPAPAPPLDTGRSSATAEPSGAVTATRLAPGTTRLNTYSRSASSAVVGEGESSDAFAATNPGCVAGRGVRGVVSSCRTPSSGEWGSTSGTMTVARSTSASSVRRSTSGRCRPSSLTGMPPGMSVTYCTSRSYRPGPGKVHASLCGIGLCTADPKRMTPGPAAPT
mmetsp:Transcript_25885/g.65839  ORF Transcript_25885/g.65839 Transcript_25885/m.65839 type:complete len:230 (-) Transcript_25885:869-1558(-)